ncbi:MAG: pirin family protein [Haliangiales bacterium]
MTNDDMSRTDAHDPTRDEPQGTDVTRVIQGRWRDIGALRVRRVLPAIGQRMVGPFLFFDHIGPAALGPGQAVDIAPHPHINLATVTYLFDGELIHRDSLGSHQAIRPGAINWMTAGRGVVHSERTAEPLRQAHGSIHGIQLWVALPTSHEEIAPSFVHYPADALPENTVDGARVRTLCGQAFGAKSPVATLSPLLYLDVRLPAGATFAVPADVPERAAYVVAGGVRCGAEQAGVGDMLVLASGQTPTVQADPDAGPEARLAIIGGEPLDGPRHMFWNFVSSSAQRIEAAKADWARGPGESARFPKIPGDDDEFIPLPR